MTHSRENNNRRLWKFTTHEMLVMRYRTKEMKILKRNGVRIDERSAPDEKEDKHEWEGNKINTREKWDTRALSHGTNQD